MSRAVLHCGDARAVLAGLPAESVDAIVTDPPYALTAASRNGSPRQNDPATPHGRTRLGGGFMGKTWDAALPGVDVWIEALRVAKPGAHLVAFGGTRTFHRLTCAIEDAGWEIRDCLSWLYGSGFPKSHNGPWGGTALKPGWEPIILARKPLVGTVAANVAEHGTGALNIDGCRIDGAKAGGSGQPPLQFGGTNHRPFHDTAEPREFDQTSGRWPANVLLDEEAGAMLDAQSGDCGANTVLTQKKYTRDNRVFGTDKRETQVFTHDAKAGASRFYYVAKASRREREAGLEGASKQVVSVWGGDEDDLTEGKKSTVPRSNNHPTVKPLSLMRWLCRLITPPGGLILDPFAGSGSTGCAAVLEGFRFVGIEREAEYVAIAEKRIASCQEQPSLWEIPA